MITLLHRQIKRLPITAEIIWSLGFVVGTTTHALDILYAGWLPYDFRPLAFNLYWTSLVFFDPLAAALIWLRERWGIIVGVVVMASNVLVNGYTAFGAGYEEFYFALSLQSAFAVFVFWCAFCHWRATTDMAKDA